MLYTKPCYASMTKLNIMCRSAVQHIMILYSVSLPSVLLHSLHQMINLISCIAGGLFVCSWVSLILGFVASIHTCPFNGPFSGTTQVSRYQKGKTNLDFTEAGDSEWQWHQLGHTQVYTSLQTDNHTSTPPFSLLLAGCSSCRPTNSVRALKAHLLQVRW